MKSTSSQGLPVIDLHSHTTASDGSMTPSELVAHARDRGATVLGITDHDTMDGIAEAKAAANQLGAIEILPGVEFSAEYPKGTMHILGYLMNPNHPELIETLQKMHDDRNLRLPKMIVQLQKSGLDITDEEVHLASRGSSIGRPHIAQVLVQKGIVKSVDEAFEVWLNRGRPGYVRQASIEPADAILVIRKAGGVSVLAHPYQLRPESDAHLETIVRQLCEMGLMGMEVWYSLHSAVMTSSYLDLANRFGLIATGAAIFTARQNLKFNWEQVRVNSRCRRRPLRI